MSHLLSIVSSPVQYKNAYVPIEVTLLGILIFARLVQFWNAPLQILVTPSPITTLVRLVQSLNAQYPISVTLSGMMILTRFEHSQNAHSSITVTLLGMTYSVKPGANATSLLSRIRHLPSSEADFPQKPMRLVHPLNAVRETEATPSGSLIYFIELQSLKALSGMAVTSLPKVSLPMPFS